MIFPNFVLVFAHNKLKWSPFASVASLCLQTIGIFSKTHPLSLLRSLCVSDKHHRHLRHAQLFETSLAFDTEPKTGPFSSVGR